MGDWNERLRTYTAGEWADDRQKAITVSKDVFEKAHQHKVEPTRNTATLTFARVRSANSDATYTVELWVDDAEIFPTFPYVWKCSCKWARHRFNPCSHVIAVALYRGRTNADEHRPTDH